MPEDDTGRLNQLIESARTHKMTEEERELQRRSLAFGNANLANPNVTRAAIDTAAARLAQKTPPLT